MAEGIRAERSENHSMCTSFTIIASLTNFSKTDIEFPGRRFSFKERKED
jgi:hypothetical protein